MVLAQAYLVLSLAMLQPLQTLLAEEYLTPILGVTRAVKLLQQLPGFAQEIIPLPLPTTPAVLPREQFPLLVQLLLQIP